MTKDVILEIFLLAFFLLPFCHGPEKHTLNDFYVAFRFAVGYIFCKQNPTTI